MHADQAMSGLIFSFSRVVSGTTMRQEEIIRWPDSWKLAATDIIRWVDDRIVLEHGSFDRLC